MLVLFEGYTTLHVWQYMNILLVEEVVVVVVVADVSVADTVDVEGVAGTGFL